MPESLDKLPPPERVRRYRELAQQAQARATRASTPQLKESYRLLAEGWHALARQTELSIRGNNSGDG